MADADLDIINYEVKIVFPPKSNTKKASVAVMAALRYHAASIVRSVETIGRSQELVTPCGLKPAAHS